MTNNMPGLELRERATALRLAGNSLREIKEITGVTSNRALADALRGVPPLVWTRRPNAGDDLHARARELRAKGYTYVEIAAELGVSRSSVSLWVRDMPRVGRLSYQEFRKRNAAGVSMFWAAESLRREARRSAISAAAAAQIGELTDREILIVGAIAYWCEGAKNKPHRRANEVAFINSDPQLISFFLRFLTSVGVDSARLICRVYIHESADVAGAQRFWQQLTGLPQDQFRSPTLKHHNPQTIRKNTGEDYHGCLTVRVRKSAELYRQIEGWASGVLTEYRQADDGAFMG
jgi:transcriptional regulator with XRE-family HTH domain